jgi:UDP-N-acetylglucosamine--N-acetylmuramyl-(pentapeptide) pyrophosphoryl-undecaprenol N-acetylglucosamine transferase
MNLENKKLLTKKILISGGGSGGHISAATAIIGGLESKYSNTLDSILYVGSNLGMEGEKSGKSLEEKLIGEESNIPFTKIRAGKLQRYLSWNSVKLLFGVFGGVIDSFKVIRKYNPDLVISTGGYVTVPICFVGKLLGKPVYIHEQTAAVGLTNKVTSKFATKIYISFPQSAQYLPKGKTLHVGNAVRAAVLDDSGDGEVVDAMKEMLKIQKEKPILLITGGGQGSHIINITIRQMIRYLVEEFQVILQTGDNKVHKDYELLKRERDRLPPNLRTCFYPTKYISSDQIGFVFKHTDLHVGRAGANFVYEMGVTQLPSIFIPIPWVTHNEQYKNAKTLADLGLAKILPEGELTPERLLSEIKKYTKRINDGDLNYDLNILKETFPLDAVDKIIDDLNL